MFTDNPEISQKKLQDSTVVMLGMGGIGSWLAYCLAGAGVGNIIGVDHDTIELTNLTRQILYCESDVGEPKIAQASKRIRAYNSEINFIPINKKLTTVAEIQDIIRGSNLVLLSADTPRGISFLVNEACINERIAWSVTGYIEMHGVCGPLVIPGQTACINCIKTSGNIDFENLTDEHSKYNASPFD